MRGTHWPPNGCCTAIDRGDQWHAPALHGIATALHTCWCAPAAPLAAIPLVCFLCLLLYCSLLVILSTGFYPLISTHMTLCLFGIRQPVCKLGLLVWSAQKPPCTLFAATASRTLPPLARCFRGAHTCLTAHSSVRCPPEPDHHMPRPSRSVASSSAGLGVSASWSLSRRCSNSLVREGKVAPHTRHRLLSSKLCTCCRCASVGRKAATKGAPLQGGRGQGGEMKLGAGAGMLAAQGANQGQAHP